MGNIAGIAYSSIRGDMIAHVIYKSLYLLWTEKKIYKGKWESIFVCFVHATKNKNVIFKKKKKKNKNVILHSTYGMPF